MRSARISDFMEQAVSKAIFPGAVLLCAIDEDIVFNASFGMADIFEKEKMSPGHIFDLASLTKPLATTSAIAKLIENNKIHLHQQIGTIIKAFEHTSKAKITIDMLLRHTSGLPAHRDYYKKIVKQQSFYRQYLRQLIVDQELENPVNSCQEYSDIGFMILSWVIEEVSQIGFEDFVYETIFYPLGIKELFFVDHKSTKTAGLYSKYKFAPTQYCPWRDKLLKGEVDDDNAWAAGGIEGHAGLFGDAVSVYKFCHELLNAIQGKKTKVLKSAVIKEFIRKESGFDMVAGFDTPSKENSSAGNFFSSGSIGHLGFTGTSFWIDPEVSLIVVLLSNRVHPSRSNEGIKEFRPKLHDLIYSIYA